MAEPAPIALPAELSQAAAWLRRRLALSAIDGAARYRGEPLPLDPATRAALSSSSQAQAITPITTPATAGVVAGLAALLAADDELETPERIDRVTGAGDPGVDPARAAEQAAADPFGALLGETPVEAPPERAEDPFRDLLG